MKKPIILFADNDAEFLATRSKFLEQEGFKVLPAINPDEARNILENRDIEIAILDLRLMNDKDDKDLSGLNLAKRVKPMIPKIILTNFPSVEAVREALSQQLEGLPPAIDFLDKKEGPQALLTAIRKVLTLENHFKELTSSIADRITDDYEDARQQAKVNFWASLIVAVVGLIVILVGVALMMGNLLAMGIPSVIVGVMGEAVSVLFFKRVDTANTRMDNYHRELLDTRQFENLLASCDELLNDENKEKYKEKVISAAIKLWLSQGEVIPQISPEKSGEV
jgi:CheY-like chemotaxis protein